MAMLEQELLTLFRQLEPDEQDRVMAFMTDIANRRAASSDFDLDEWLATTQAFHATLRAKYGQDFQVDVVGALRELREEASWPRG